MEPEKRVEIADIEEGNERDRNRLENAVLPQIPGWQVDEPPDANTEVPDLDPLQDRIDNIEVSQ